MKGNIIVGNAAIFLTVKKRLKIAVESNGSTDRACAERVGEAQLDTTATRAANGLS